MRPSWPALGAGVLVAALGAAGLIRGAQSQSSASGAPPAPIVVTNATVHALSGHTAAAYFTVYNTTDEDDRLTEVASGAGANAVLQLAGAGGRLHARPQGVVVHAHDSLVIGPHKGRVMIEGVFGTLRRGQSVDLQLSFATAGPVDVVAEVK